MPSLPRRTRYLERANQAHQLQQREWRFCRTFLLRASASDGKIRTRLSEFANAVVMQWPGPLYCCIGRGRLEVWDRPNRGLFDQLRFASDDRQRGKEND